ncbi:hypothetical protein GCM10009546_29210 [Actinomadura livida]|uniref:Uncharacterized protein n=1 Tax=Actinomadura livida TaxID=79909 RepID=A0ABN1EEW3_9ACTN|nr:hypothetical protein GCM10010208_33970 [Actinomadura livida]
MRIAYGSSAAYSSPASRGTVVRSGTTRRRPSSAETVVLLFMAIPSNVGPAASRGGRWCFSLYPDIPAIYDA